ncbi:hypothetical protein [Telluribacter sp. SYSU D00476]|uniref:hypothetical protein n=1 Tax=Telluribacter sp. SYSU D00476 TaxID=2811430 RepID=UPI001FF15D81|nr:hypothetical protein [Telluribacter sp. SYSU D00476]
MKRKSLLYTAGVVALLYSCSTKDLSSVDPFGYSVKDLEKVSLPEVSFERPAPITVAPGALKVTALGAAAVTELSGTGTLSSSTQQFADAVVRTAPQAEASAVIRETTSATLAQILNQKAYTGAQKGFISSFKKLPAQAAGYLPQLTLPVVQGKPAAARTGAVEGTAAPVTVEAVTKGEDGCKSSALEALQKVLQKLQDKKGDQLAKAEAEYQKDLKEARTADKCEAEKNRKSAVQELDKKYKKLYSDLEKNKKNTTSAAALNALFYAELDGINTLYQQELAACNQAVSLREAAAMAAFNNNKQKIEAGYKQEADKATGIANAIINACHNQGGGK